MSTKETMLCLLEAAGGKFVSGSELARIAGVSRNAIWKSAAALRETGFEIEAGEGGYRMAGDTFCAELIKHYAKNDFGITFFPEIGSTNREAAAIASSVPLPHMVAAASQSGGRGRRGKSFFSQGGIYFSMILSADSVKIPPMLLTTAAACAALRAIEAEYDASPRIKWINDIYIGEKKVCGILTEAQSDLETGTFSHYIVGIGINTGGGEFPPEIADIACSLDPARVRKNRLCAAAADNLLAYIEEAPEKIVRLASEKSCVIGKEIRFFGAGEEGSGTAVALGEKGELIVRTDDGKEKILSGGEISVRFAKNPSHL
ncbi:MAG: biotin--[acetyl-CoA-carboxylase] ligase [Eubacteriales bacterium]